MKAVVGEPGACPSRASGSDTLEQNQPLTWSRYGFVQSLLASERHVQPDSTPRRLAQRRSDSPSSRAGGVSPAWLGPIVQMGSIQQDRISALTERTTFCVAFASPFCTPTAAAVKERDGGTVGFGGVSRCSGAYHDYAGVPAIFTKSSRPPDANREPSDGDRRTARRANPRFVSRGPPVWRSVRPRPDRAAGSAPLIARSTALQIDPSPPNPVTTQSDWNCEKSASPITGTAQNFAEFLLKC